MSINQIASLPLRAGWLLSLEFQGEINILWGTAIGIPLYLQLD